MPRLSRAVAAGSTHDLRLVPVAAVAWVGAWLGTSLSMDGLGTSLSMDGLGTGLAGADRWSMAVLVGILIAVTGLTVVAVRWRALIAGAIAVALAGTVTVGALAAWRVGSGPISDLAPARAVVTVEGVLRTDLLVRSGQFGDYATVRMRVSEVTARGRSWQVRTPLLIVVGGDPAVASWRQTIVGTTVRVTGRLEAAERGSDVAAVLRVRGSPDIRAPPGRSLQLVERVRTGLREAVASRPAEPRALVPALVLGDTSAITDELRQSFQTTGLTHLTAVSGANLSLLLAFLLFGAKWLGVRGRGLRVVGLAAVVVFVALCRTEPSVLRAAAMGLVTLAALGAGGGRKALRHLAVAVLLLVLVDPFLARTIGFALSVLASAGIVWWASAWASLATWCPRPLAEAIAVPLAAHLATMPVVAALSGSVSVSGLLANALAGPFVGPATVLGFAAAGISLASPWLAGTAGWGASWCAQLIIWIAHAGAALPGAAWRWPVTPLALGVLGVAALSLGLSMRLLATHRWLAIGASVLLVASMLTGPVQPGWPPRNWRIVACDVGQGDGLVLRAGPGQAVVVDVGPDPGAIRQCLSGLRIRSVPLVVLTHFHADHVGGLAGVMGRFPVGQVWVSPFASPAAEAAEVRELTLAAGTVVRSPLVGETGRAGEVWWQVLGPVGTAAVDRGAGEGGDAGESVESGAENDASVVLRVGVGDLTVLLTGDVEPAGQARILATGVDLHAVVLKLPHHGSSRQDREFFAATGARIAIASAGQKNSYGHPAPSTVRLATSLGMSVLRTDRQGSVAITEQGGRMAAVTQR